MAQLGKKLILLLITIGMVIILTSCEIFTYFKFKNVTSDEILFNVVRSDTVFQYRVQGRESTKKMVVGYNRPWTDKYIRNYTREIYEIQVFTETDTIVVSDQDKIIELFKKGRRGIFKTVIVFKIDDAFINSLKNWENEK